MPLNFVKVITPPQNEPQNFLANQPDNKLYQHYVTTKHSPWQVYAQITLADYDNLAWSMAPEVCMTPREVMRIGVKTFPQLGAVGFYRLLYRDSSRVVVPLHPEKDKPTAPTISLVLNDEKKTISYSITPPDDQKVAYDCYRIELECDGQTVSHIAYELSGEFEVPEQAGAFRCYAIGYLQEGQICSKDSNVVSLDLPGNKKTSRAAFYTKEEIDVLEARLKSLEDSGLPASSVILYGTDAPTDDLGADGQLYVQWKYE